MTETIEEIEALINQAIEPVSEPILSTRFKIQTTKDALAPRESRKWVVDNLFHEGSVNVVFGKSGHKKSVALVDLAVCIIQGKEWLGKKTERKPVIWIDEDNGDHITKERIDFALNGHLAYDHEELYFTSLQEFDAANTEDLEELRNLIYLTRSGAVFFDALQDISPGKTENAAEEMRPIFAELRKIAEETGVAIFIIHHTNKTGEDFRGSTAIEGKSDVMLKIFSDSKTNLINFKTTKHRSIIYQEFWAQAHFNQMNNGKFQTRLSLRDKPKNAPDENALTGKRKMVLGYLLDNGETEESVLREKCSVSRGMLNSLKDIDLIERTDKGGQGSKSTVTLTLRGKKLIQVS